MSKLDATKNGILTEQQFNSSPFKNIMSYSDYFANALKLGSAFTFQRALTMQKSDNLSEDIKDSVKGWALEKEVKKDEAEAKYYAALEQYNLMKYAEDDAKKNLLYATNMYGKDSSKYNDAFKKYNLSAKSLFGADIDLSCARDQFNFANTSAFKAYLTSSTLSS